MTTPNQRDKHRRHSVLRPRSKAERIGAIAISLSCLLPALASADMAEADYQAALGAARKKAERTRSAPVAALSLNPQSTAALSPSSVRNFLGRGYRVGDRWQVAAWVGENTTARMTAAPSGGSQRGTTAVFQYEVLSVKDGPAPEVSIRVSQLGSYGQKKADPRVESLSLLLNDRMLQSRKTYRIADRAGRVHPVEVDPEGIHSAITRLEMFPLDVPDIATAESVPARALPPLPAALQAIATQAGYGPDPARCVAYEQDDFFGRGMRIVWKQGDPWPAYLKTDTGVAILIHTELSGGR